MNALLQVHPHFLQRGDLLEDRGVLKVGYAPGSEGSGRGRGALGVLGREPSSKSRVFIGSESCADMLGVLLDDWFSSRKYL